MESRCRLHLLRVLEDERRRSLCTLLVPRLVLAPHTVPVQHEDHVEPNELYNDDELEHEHVVATCRQTGAVLLDYYFSTHPPQYDNKRATMTTAHVSKRVWHQGRVVYRAHFSSRVCVPPFSLDPSCVLSIRDAYSITENCISDACAVEFWTKHRIGLPSKLGTAANAYFATHHPLYLPQHACYCPSKMLSLVGRPRPLRQQVRTSMCSVSLHK